MQTTTTRQVFINDREAIPVRKIPYVTSLFIKPHELCCILANRQGFPRPLFMESHYLDADGTLHTMQPQAWEQHIDEMEHLESGLREAEGFNDENYPKWEEHAIKRLPGGVFVWRDDLEQTCMKKQEFVKRDIGGDNDLTSRKPFGWQYGGALRLDAYIPPKLHLICTEGFEAFLPPASPVTRKQSEQASISLSHGDQPLIEPQLHGDHCSVTFRGRTETVKTTNGMHYYKYLTERPRKIFSGLELVKQVFGKTPDNKVTDEEAKQSGLEIIEDTGDSGETIDEKAIAEYKKDLKRIERDKVIADTTGNKDRLKELENEEDFIRDQLAKDLNIHGKPRVSGKPNDKARSSIKHALDTANTNIAKVHPELAQHLRDHTKTGNDISFQPDPPDSPGAQL